MQSPASYGCAWTISDRPRAEQSRCGGSRRVVCLHKDVVRRCLHGKQPRKLPWHRKLVPRKELSLARKEILISAVRLTVDLSPFLQLTLSYEIGSRWQRQLCLTALHICRYCSKFYTRHLHAPRPTPLSLHVKIVHKRKICKAQDWKKKRTKK